MAKRVSKNIFCLFASLLRGGWLSTFIALSLTSALIPVISSANGLECKAVFEKEARPLVEHGQSFWSTRGDRKILVRVDGPANMKDVKGTLVLINGLDRGLRSWDPFMAELRESYRIIRMDLWGQGETLAQNGLTGSFAIDDLIRDIDVAVRTAGTIGSLKVIGHSFGGGVGLMMLKKSRLKMTDLFLLAPYAPRQEEDQPFIGDLFKLSRERMGPWHGMMMNFGMAAGMYMGHSLQSMEIKTATETGAVVQLTSAIGKEDITGSLRGATVRVHMLVSGADVIVPREAHKKLWASIPEAIRGSFIYLRAGSHFIPEREKEAQAASRTIGLILENDQRFEPGMAVDVDLMRMKASIKKGDVSISAPLVELIQQAK